MTTLTAHQPELRAARRTAGSASIAVHHIEGRSAVTTAQAANPLRLLTPRRAGPAAWVYTSTYGGGLVGGDVIDMNLEVGPGATAVLATQASTKVYRTVEGRGAAQHLHATLGENARLIVAPDPVTPFADAVYDQDQRFDLAPGANHVLVDWFTAGRVAMGERWAFDRYAVRTTVTLDGKLVLIDALTLDRADGPIDTPMRGGRFNCIATVLWVGENAAAAGEVVVKEIETMPAAPGAEVLVSASQFHRGPGAIVRLAGVTTAAVTHWVRRVVSLTEPWLGEGPWSRRW